MPGIVGIVRTSDAAVSLGKAIEKLLHFPAYFSRSIELNEAVSIGQVWRKEKESKEDWYFDHGRRAGAFINGAVLIYSPVKRRLSAKDVLEDYIRNDFPAVDKYEGGFAVVIVDLKRNLLFVCNDRLGTLPVYYTRNQNGFCFAPEVKSVLAALRMRPKLSMAGVINFLAIGYCLADTTLFENVDYLEPGCVLSVGINTLDVEKIRYWKMVYESSPSLRRKKAAEDALFETIIEAHRLILADKPKKFELHLSGGLDSRGNLAVLDHIGALPDRAFCWGLRDDLPDSDAYISKLSALEYGVPFDFLKYDTNTFNENVHEWVYLSELANDNIGWYAEGASVLAKHYNTGADFAITGDESWGSYGYAYNQIEAIDYVVPYSLPEEMRKSTASSHVDEIEEIYREQIRKVIRWCDSDNFTDIKDFLYLHGRLARFIFSLGYYKELAVEIRRPFLTSSVLEVVRRMPRKHRVFKNLYLSMLKRHLPRSMRIPTVKLSSLPDWPHDVRKNDEIREFFLKYLDLDRVNSGILGKWLEPHDFTEIKNGFFLAEARPVSRVPKNRESQIYRFLKLITHRSELIYRLNKPMRSQIRRIRTSFDFLRCVALIVLLEEQLNAFSEPNA